MTHEKENKPLGKKHMKITAKGRALRGYAIACQIRKNRAPFVKSKIRTSEQFVLQKKKELKEERKGKPTNILTVGPKRARTRTLARL